MSGIYIVGDIHAEFKYLTDNFINKFSPDILLCCGDFGYWWNNKVHLFYHDYLLTNKKCKIYFCDGNHERHDLLKKLVIEHGWKKPIEIKRNVFYCPRGSSLTLPNGKNVLFFGGADSIDKGLRTVGVDWFQEENITQYDIDRIDNSIKYHIVISHTCPKFLVNDMKITLGLSSFYPKYSDPNCDALNEVFNKVKPSEWFFGHWHNNYSNVVNGCKFTCLNMVPRESYFLKYSD